MLRAPWYQTHFRKFRVPICYEEAPHRLFALTLSFNSEPELAELEVCCSLGYFAF